MNGGGALGIAHLTDVVALGSGAGSDHYAATDLKLDRRVSVRVFDPVVDAEDRKRFGDASRTLGQVSAHPNVVTLYEAGFTTSDQPFLILEMVESGSLAQRLADGPPLDWTEAVGIAIQLCGGLGKAHEAGTLHRNIRPESVMMAGGAAKLTDFVIAADGPSAAPNENHAAPETFDGDGDTRSDLYSLASVLFEMIDGNAPFWRPGESSPDATMLRVRHQAPPDLDESVPEPLAIFVRAALSKDVLDRPQTADEFAHELRLLLERHAAAGASLLHTTASTPAVSPALSPAVSPAGPAAAAAPMVASATTQPPIGAAAFAGSGLDAQTAALATPPSAPPVPVGFADGQQSVGVGTEPGGPATALYQTVTPPTADQTAAAAAWAAPAAGVGVMDPAPPPPIGEPDWAPPPEPSADGFPPPVEPDGALAHDHPRRSPLFLVAIGLIAVGVLGLASVLAIAGFGGDDEPQAAPALPDPNATIAVDAVDDATAEAGTSDSMVDGEAMVEDGATTSTTEAQAMEQTTTTVGRIVVPNVVGLDVAAATKTLSDAGLQVIVISRVAPNAQPGTVADQKPDPNSEALPGLSVTIYIPRVSALPQMVGRPADVVCAELVALRLQCNRTEANSDTVAVGSVISTNPGGGAQFSEGAVVEVLVSRGPVVDVVVPDVAGMTEEDARALLRTTGFSAITSAMEPSADRAQGMATRTNPAAAASVRSDQPVTLYISSGPPSQAMAPNVVGMTQADAEAALAQAGLVVAVATSDLPEGDAGIGMVLSMDPVAGTAVATGATVTITVGRLAAPENPPSSTTTTVMSDESTTTTAAG